MLKAEIKMIQSNSDEEVENYYNSLNEYYENIQNYAYNFFRLLYSKQSWILLRMVYNKLLKTLPMSKRISILKIEFKATC